MKKRKHMLYELLKYTFGRTTISIVEKQISFTGSWFSECKFDETAYKRYCKLFKLALSSEKIEIIDNNNHVTTFNSEKFLLNAIEYLEMYGIEFFELYEYNKIEEKISELVYQAFSQFLLPAILFSDMGKEKIERENEDITEIFDNAIKGIRRLKNSAIADSFLNSGNAAVSLYDSGYDKEKPNYSIDCGMIMPTNLIHKIEEIRPLAYCIYYSGQLLSKEEAREMLTAWFVRILKNENLSQNKQQKFEMYPIFISKYRIHPEFWNHKTYKFFISIDGEMIYECRSENPEQFILFLNEKAKCAMEQHMQPEFDKYCYSVFQFVQDVLERMFSLNLEKIINADNFQIPKEELPKIVLNFGEVYSILGDYENKENIYAEQVYFIIQNIILKITQMLKKQGKIFAETFKRVVPVSELEQHMKFIKKFLSSSKLESAEQIQKWKIKENPELFKVPASIEDSYIYRIPELFSDFKLALNCYYHFFMK